MNKVVVVGAGLGGLIFNYFAASFRVASFERNPWHVLTEIAIG